MECKFSKSHCYKILKCLKLIILIGIIYGKCYCDLRVIHDKCFCNDSQLYACMSGIFGFLFDNAIALSVTGFPAWVIDYYLNKCRCGKKILSTATDIEEHVGMDMNIGKWQIFFQILNFLVTA